MLFITAAFVNNIVLAQFLGMRPVLESSKKAGVAAGMSVTIALVMTAAAIVTFLIRRYVLDVFGLAYLQTVSFILVVVALAWVVDVALKTVSPALYRALGELLPLVTINCAVLGVAILAVQKDFSLLSSIVFAFSTAIGLGLVLIIFSGIYEQLSYTPVPKNMRGAPIALITAGILAMAFMGFIGMG